MAWSDLGQVFDPAGIVTKKKASWAPDPLGLSQDPSLAPQVTDQGYGQMLQQLREAGPTTAQQQALTSNLVGAVYGNGPSVAQSMAAGLNAQGQRQALGNAAAGVSGGNSSLALRTGQQVAGNMSQQAAGQMGALRAQEIQGARGQALQNQANSTQAQMGALAGVQGIADKNLALKQEQQSGAQGRLGTGLAMFSDERVKTDIAPESPAAMDSFVGSLQQTDAENPDERQKKKKSQGSAVMNGLGKMAGSLSAQGDAMANIMVSDRNAKADVHGENSQAMNEFVNSLQNPVGYEYKGSAHPEHGIIAQDVEKGGPIGRNIVVDMGGMKGIDLPRAVGALMQAVGHLSRKVDARG